MNYKIYHDNHEFSYTFNYINTVGDLQTIILQTLNIPKKKLLYIIYQSKFLGIDYSFNDNLIEKELYDIKLLLVIDNYEIDIGTKNLYSSWLRSKLTSNDIIDVNQQLLYFNTHNDRATNNLDFFNFRSRNNNNYPPIPSTTHPSVPSSVPSSVPISTTPTTSSVTPLSSRRRNVLSRLFSSSRPSSTSDVSPTTTNQTNTSPINSNTSPNAASTTTTSRNNIGAHRSRRETSQSQSNSRHDDNERSHRRSRHARRNDDDENTLNNLLNEIFSTGNITTNPPSSFLNSNSLTDIFNEMINQNIYDLGVTVTQGPNGNTVGLMATGNIFNMTSLGNEDNNSNFFNILLNNLQPVPVTLSRETVNRLPQFKFEELPAEIVNTNNTCSICLENFNNSDPVRVLLCKHYFHVSCIDHWLTSENVRCPLCRHDNRDESPPHNNHSNTNHLNTTQIDDSDMESADDDS